MITETVIVPLVKLVILFGGILTAAAYFVLLERRMAAWIQDRLGPNRVGIPLTKIRLAGLGQPIADGLKMIFKEEYTPHHVDRPLYWLAPIAIMASSVAVFAVIPFGSQLPPMPSLGIEQPILLVGAPWVDVGMIYVFALSSIAVYGVILGGWASNSKYSFLGALRASAQMIAYELPLGLGILGVVLATGSLRLDTIIAQQADSGVWFIFAQPLGFIVFLTAAFAEASRLPFDLAESEQELVGGYHTEYNGMKLICFLTSEFIHMITASFLIVILFLGGWHFWGLTGTAETDITWGLAILRIAVLMFKIVLVILFFMLVRWTFPRFRFDQLMALAWKVMLPLGIANLAAVAVLVEVLHPRVYGEAIGAALGGWLPVVVCLIGWIVALVAWLVVAWAAPTLSDNRNRLGVGEQNMGPLL
jgi:NADH-quinone oxidoreductase subunit H